MVVGPAAGVDGSVESATMLLLEFNLYCFLIEYLLIMLYCATSPFNAGHRRKKSFNGALKKTFNIRTFMHFNKICP